MPDTHAGHPAAALELAATRANEYLETVVARSIDLPSNLYAAVQYSLLAGGKRLRPGLVLISCEACGGASDHALASAAAIEMVHCFSLIHDDLPAMDDDDLRRGQPSSHKKFGEPMAILSGDALSTLPYLVIARDTSLSDQQRARLTLELSDATMRMIAGQVYDTLGGFEESVGERDRLEITHRNKTGALIRAACRMGAIVAHATDEQLESLSNFGEAIGLMFQIVDDVLDVTQTTEHLGKRAGKDEDAGKRTYPTIHGLDESRRLIETLRCDALSALTVLDRDQAQPLVELAGTLASRTK